MIETYLEDAKRNSGLPSDRQLAKALGIDPTSVFAYRHGRALPSDAVMLQLSDLAGIPAEQALMDLALMRSNSEPAKAILLKIKNGLTTVCLLMICYLSLTNTATASPIQIDAQYSLHDNCIYYGKYKKYLSIVHASYARFKRFLSSFLFVPARLCPAVK